MLRCLLHLERNGKDLLREQSGAAKDRPDLFLQWLSAVFALKKEAPGLTGQGYADRADILEASWDWMVEHVRHCEDDERNLASWRAWTPPPSRSRRCCGSGP